MRVAAAEDRNSWHRQVEYLHSEFVKRELRRSHWGASPGPTSTCKVHKTKHATDDRPFWTASAIGATEKLETEMLSFKIATWEETNACIETSRETHGSIPNVITHSAKGTAPLESSLGRRESLADGPVLRRLKCWPFRVSWSGAPHHGPN